jgi:hypothetical protein
MDIKSKQINLTSENQLKSTKTTNFGGADFADELKEIKEDKKEFIPTKENLPTEDNKAEQENIPIHNLNNISINKPVKKKSTDIQKSVDNVKVDSNIKNQTKVELDSKQPIEKTSDTEIEENISINLENLQKDINNKDLFEFLKNIEEIFNNLNTKNKTLEQYNNNLQLSNI